MAATIASGQTRSDAPVGPNASAGANANLERVGRFEVRQRLGAGAFCCVYRAYDPQLDREVALKVPHPGSLEGAARVTRFLREAKAAANLRHPNIVPVYDSGRDGDHYFIASALIPGTTLAGDLGEGNAFKPKQAARLVQSLADALAYAHDKGVVHRDVKPANIMLDTSGAPFLMDFGLASRRDEASKLTNEGAVLGTPSYMAPEQAAGRSGEAGPAADQYSLGCVLFELLTGDTPFGGPPEVQVFHHIRTEPKSPRELNPNVPVDLAAICLKCLEKDSARRYPTCGALSADLERFVAGRPVLAAPAGPLVRAAKWVRREPVVAGLGSTLFVVLTAWLFWMLSGVIFKVKTPEGTLVVEVNESNPEIFLDGRKVTVTWGENGKKAEITVRPGTHQVEVKKDGFTAFGDQVTLEDQGRKAMTVLLTKAQPVPGPLADKLPPTSSVDDRPVPQLPRINELAAPKPSPVPGPVVVQPPPTSSVDVNPVAQQPRINEPAAPKPSPVAVVQPPPTSSVDVKPVAQRPRLEPIAALPKSINGEIPIRPKYDYPRNGQKLDLGGDYLFQVGDVPGASGYLWNFHQNGKTVWENYKNEGKLSGASYGLPAGSAGWKAFHAGEVEVTCRAYVNNEWTWEGKIKIILQPRKKSAD
jgi:hypothetical protein